MKHCKEGFCNNEYGRCECPCAECWKDEEDL